MIIRIPIQCRSKKNSQQILYNKKTRKPFISQGELYKQFERECGYFLNRYRYNIDYPINLKCTFYMKDKRRRDLVNLLNAIQDVLVKYKVIKDDNCNIIKSLDGSKIIYRPNEEPSTVIEITKYEEE